MSSQLPSLPLLKGKENYRPWSIKMRAYLKHQDLWCTIEVPNKEDGTPGQISKDVAKLTKAQAIIELACHDNILSIIEKKNSAKATWEALKSAFEDGGYSRLVRLLINLVTTKLDDCASVEEYIDAIMKKSNQINDTGLGVVMPDVAIGALMLAGLPAKYETLSMAIGGSNAAITSDLVKQKILQEVKIDSDLGSGELTGVQSYYSKEPRGRGYLRRGGFSRSRSNNRRGASTQRSQCFRCNKYGHLARDCRLNHGNNRSFAAQAQEQW